MEPCQGGGPVFQTNDARSIRYVDTRGAFSWNRRAYKPRPNTLWQVGWCQLHQLQPNNTRASENLRIVVGTLVLGSLWELQHRFSPDGWQKEAVCLLGKKWSAIEISKMSTTGGNVGQRTLHHETISHKRLYVRSRIRSSSSQVSGAYDLYHTCRLRIKGNQLASSRSVCACVCVCEENGIIVPSLTLFVFSLCFFFRTVGLWVPDESYLFSILSIQTIKIS